MNVKSKSTTSWLYCVLVRLNLGLFVFTFVCKFSIWWIAFSLYILFILMYELESQAFDQHSKLYKYPATNKHLLLWQQICFLFRSNIHRFNCSNLSINQYTHHKYAPDCEWTTHSNSRGGVRFWTVKTINVNWKQIILMQTDIIQPNSHLYLYEY